MNRLSHLREELKKSLPFPREGQEALISMMRTTSMLKRRLEAVVQDEGITAKQYNILRILRGSKEPLPVMEIADRVIEVEPGITRMMARLETKELIRRVRSSEDGRRVDCTITKKGLDILSRLDDPIVRFETKALGDLSTEELTQLIFLLAKARATVPKFDL